MTSVTSSGVEEKVQLLRTAYRHLSVDLGWEEGDGGRFPWVHAELNEIERELSSLAYEELRKRLRALYKRIAAAKGRRGYRQRRDSHTNTGRASARKQSEAGGKAEAEAPPVKGADVPINLTVKDFSPIGEGQHRAAIRSVEERESKFSDSKHRTYLAITFEITQGKDAGRTLTKGYSPVLSSKSHLGQLWRRLKGSLPVGQTVDVEGLIGEQVDIVVVHDAGEDGDVRERIAEVFKPLSGDAAEAEKALELEEAVS